MDSIDRHSLEDQPATHLHFLFLTLLNCALLVKLLSYDILAS